MSYNQYGQSAGYNYNAQYGHDPYAQQPQQYQASYGHADYAGQQPAHPQSYAPYPQSYAGQPQSYPAYDPYAASAPQDPYAQPQQGHYAYPPPATYAQSDQSLDARYRDEKQQPQQPAELRDGTLAGEYAAAQQDGLKPSSQSRGSKAAQLAAEGSIPEKTGLKMWRSDAHAGEFTRGGKTKCCGRCCCCTFMVFFLLVVGIIAAFLLWVRPPNITFNGVESPADGSEQVALVNAGFLLSFGLNIGVTNPNFFGAKFSKIKAEAFYPGHKDVALGGGQISNVNIKSHSNTTIHFPFKVNYTTELDPDRSILTDLASKCGFLGSTRSPITVNYKLTLDVKVAAFNINPSFSSSTSFDCPLKQSDIASVLGSSSGSVSGLLGALGGGRKSRRDLVDASWLDDLDHVLTRRIRPLTIVERESGNKMRKGLALAGQAREKRSPSLLSGLRKGFGISATTTLTSETKRRRIGSDDEEKSIGNPYGRLFKRIGELLS